jgi:hypothetical protein
VFPQLGHEAAEGCEASHEPMNILDVPGLAYFRDGQNLVGFALMSCSVMMYPRSLPWGTPKVHFFGFNLTLNCLRLLKVSSRLAMRLLLF